MNRYDGRTIKQFNFDNSDLSSSDIIDILITSKDSLYISSANGGLYRYDFNIDTFLLHVGVVDNASTPASDEGLVLVVLDVEAWVPSYQDEPSTSLELYPNPATDFVTVKLGESGIRGQASLAIYGSDGRLQHYMSLEQIQQYEIQLSVDQLEKGVYHVVLESENEKRIGKLMILDGK